MSIAAISLALALPLCAAPSESQVYPSDWSPVMTTPLRHGCPNLTGTFSNYAAAVYPPDAGAAPPLSNLFAAIGKVSSHELHGSWGPIGESVSGSFTQAGDDMAVAFPHAGSAETELTLQRWTMGKAYSPQRGDFFICLSSRGEPRLVLNSTVDDHKPIPPNTVGTQLILLRAVDGSLIVLLRSNSFEVIDLGTIGGPIVHHSSVWYRYPSVPAGTNATVP